MAGRRLKLVLFLQDQHQLNPFMTLTLIQVTTRAPIISSRRFLSQYGETLTLTGYQDVGLEERPTWLIPGTHEIFYYSQQHTRFNQSYIEGAFTGRLTAITGHVIKN